VELPRSGHKGLVGLPVSLCLIVLGAILAFAVERNAHGLNVHAVGWILMIVGVVGFVLSMILWDRLGFGARRTAYRTTAYPPEPYPDEAPTAYQRRGWGYPRRRTVVDEVDEGPPAAGPPPL
jgi:Domain of unknown function (DUF6458)